MFIKSLLLSHMLITSMLSKVFSEGHWIKGADGWMDGWMKPALGENIIIINMISLSTLLYKNYLVFNITLRGLFCSFYKLGN